MPQSAEKLIARAAETGSAAPQEAEPAALPCKFFDEMRAPDGKVRRTYGALASLLDDLSIESLVTKQNAAEELFRRLGITFAVYAEGGSTERLIPFDLIPRILDRAEWDLIERGCIQRVKAINIFLYDIYHDQEIIKAGLVPAEFVLLNPAFRPEMLGIEPPNATSTPISPASTSSAPASATSSCSRTMCARRRASPMCSRTARS